MANLDFNQCATLLSSITAQATGRATITPTDATSFVSVATTALETGYDSVIKAISQVLSKTIFSVRPYSRKFSGLSADSMRYGNHVRKLSVVESSPEDDQRFGIEHGQSVDMQKVNKPGIVQTNFYGANVYQRHITIFKDQLDVAFSNASEFGHFIAMIVQNVSDEMEKDHEECARFTLCNFIAGKTKNDTANVIHLVSEYNTATGSELDSATVRKPENFVPFMKWAVARIRSISELMTERCTMFHVNLTDKPIPRHTPLAKQHVYLYAPAVHEMETSVLSTVYHDEYLKKVDFETVNFWQSIKSPTDIKIKANYMVEDGTVTSADVNLSNVFGIIFDEEALGVTTVNQWSAPSPFNSAGGYTNTYYHFTDRYWNDFTENAVVLTLD